MNRRWALAALALGLGASCDNPHPALQAVEPGQGYSDGDLRLLLVGEDFIPATVLDPQSGRRIATSDGFTAHIGTGGYWTALPALDWLATGALAVSLPRLTAQRLPRAKLDVRITDPRGRSTTLPEGFTELGHDETAPTITFTSPDSQKQFAPGMLLRVSFHASDAPPGRLADVYWDAFEDDISRGHGACPVAAEASEADCDFQFPISPSLAAGDIVRITASASDAAMPSNLIRANFSVTLQPLPVLIAISPAEGGTGGGTDVIVSGAYWPVGSQVMVDGEPLFPYGGKQIDNTSIISGSMPPHAAGTATISLHTPLGDAVDTQTFTYLPPPRIEAINPDVGSSAGGTVVTIAGSGFDHGTRIYFGTTLDAAAALLDPFLQSDGSIVGRAPAGTGVTTVWAMSDALGVSRLPAGFTWRAP